MVKYRVYRFQSFRYVFMDSAFGNSEFFCSLSDGRVIFYYVKGDGDGTLFRHSLQI